MAPASDGFASRFAIASAQQGRNPARGAAWLRACVVIALCAAPLCARAADGIEWNGYATLATDYVYRGLSLLDSGINVQGSVEARIDDRFVAGVWATNIDREWQYYRELSDHLEVNGYAGVDFGCGGRCRARFLVTRYTYPGSDAESWNEATASIGFAERIGASFSWSPRGLGFDRPLRTVEGWYVQPLTRSTSVEIDGGKLTAAGHGYWFSRAGISHRIDRFVFDLSHYWSDPKYRRVGLDDRSQRFVLSVSTAF